MSEMRALVRKSPGVLGRNPRTAANKRFSKYKPEKKKAVRKPKVKEDKTLKLLKKIWKEFEMEEDDASSNDASFKKALFGFKLIEYTAEDVERFSIVLAEFQDEKYFSDKAGTILSALIEASKDSEFVIRTEHLGVPITGLGSYNTKNITVYGNGGDYLGCEMRGGSIVVEGDAGDYLGCEMMGGSIVVGGDTGEHLGYEMRGGSIVVEGNTGNHAGWVMHDGCTIIVKGNAIGVTAVNMQGGELRIEGDLDGGIHTIFGGKITIKGNVRALATTMLGGEIHVEGEIGIIDCKIEKGKIYHKGKLILSK